MNSSGHRQPAVAYLAPRWVGPDQLRIPIDDVGFLQAATAVERLRTYRQRPLEVAAHLRRFCRSAAALSIALPDDTTLASLIDQLLRRNADWLTEQGDVGIVLFATPGRGGAGVAPTLGMHLTSLDHPAIKRRQQFGQPLVITDVRQPPAASWPRDIKVRCRLHYYLADHQAQAVDRDAVGLLLDDDGTITETSVANVAIVRDGCIVSPPKERVLPGVTQAQAMRLALAAGIQWQQRSVSVHEVRQADEILLLGTTTGIWHAWLAPATVPPPRGTVCTRLQADFATAVATSIG